MTPNLALRAIMVAVFVVVGSLGNYASACEGACCDYTPTITFSQDNLVCNCDCTAGLGECSYDKDIWTYEQTCPGEAICAWLADEFCCEIGKWHRYKTTISNTDCDVFCSNLECPCIEDGTEYTGTIFCSYIATNCCP